MRVPVVVKMSQQYSRRRVGLVRDVGVGSGFVVGIGEVVGDAVGEGGTSVSATVSAIGVGDGVGQDGGVGVDDPWSR